MSCFGQVVLFGAHGFRDFRPWSADCLAVSLWQARGIMAESHCKGKTAQVMAIRKQRETGRVTETVFLGCMFPPTRLYLPVMPSS